MSYSAMAHALTGYVEGHLECFDIRSMSECFGFSQAYLRELFLKNMDMPIMQYYRRRRLITSASELLHSDRRIIDIALAATRAAFRLVWNREMWDLSNVDIYHTLRESNDIYACGAKALGREFSFLGRDETATKEAFTEYMKEAIAQGFPVIALGIIGPPEPCIVAGYEADGAVVMGWNFFQNDAEFASSARTADNGKALEEIRRLCGQM
ncbi:MAG: hypothetical protein K2P40_01510 [Lachnospiraceae bacterium]|nr:hypothetical protein [Lachnospiraceae bacterium]MDE6939611.1 hypothetical protein [Lachnospiraceae bacterium]